MQQRDYVLLASAINTVRKGLAASADSIIVDNLTTAIADAFSADHSTRGWFHRDSFLRLCVIGLASWPCGTLEPSASPHPVERSRANAEVGNPDAPHSGS